MDRAVWLIVGLVVAVLVMASVATILNNEAAGVKSFIGSLNLVMGG